MSGSITEQNVSLSEGFLTITAKEENFGGQNYTSSRIKTEGQVDFTYGRVDIRALSPRVARDLAGIVVIGHELLDGRLASGGRSTSWK